MYGDPLQIALQLQLYTCHRDFNAGTVVEMLYALQHSQELTHVDELHKLFEDSEALFL